MWEQHQVHRVSFLGGSFRYEATEKVRLINYLKLFRIQIDKNKLTGKACTFSLYFGNFIVDRKKEYHSDIEIAKLAALNWAKELLNQETDLIEQNIYYVSSPESNA